MGEGFKVQKGTPIFDTNIYLYKEGDECTALTGGWLAYAAKKSGESPVETAPTLTKNAGDMAYSLLSPNKCGVVKTVNKIDLTNFNTLHIIHKGTLGTYNASNIISLNAGTITSTLFTISADMTMVYTGAVSNYTEVSFDVSALNSTYDIFVRVQSTTNSASGSCTKIWLEA